MHAEAIAQLFGGEQALEARIHSFEDWDRLIRKGLPTQAVRTLVQTLDMQRSVVLDALGMPRSTWSRRIHGKRFGAEESDRVYRLAYIVARAEEVLGSRDKALRWLVRPNRALHGDTPLSRIETEAGYETVKALLGRLDHGVYS